MAELSSPAAIAQATNGHEPASGADAIEAPAPAIPVVVDPRAVRVHLAATSRLVDEAPLRVAPATEPLRMTNPTVGRGLLGGAATPAEPPVTEPGEGSVLAQRQVLVDDVASDAVLRPAGHDRHVLEEAGIRTRVVLEPAQPVVGGIRRREVIVDGFRFDVEVEAERIASLRERASRGRAASVRSGPLEVKAIIPGKVVSISIAPGDAVTAGQQLLVVEAMKMQNELRSPRDGTIDRVGVAPGVNIEVGDLLVVIS